MTPWTWVRRLFRKRPVVMPGPLGDAFSAQRKRLKVMLSLPSADAAAERQVEQEGYVGDIPVEQMLYRSSQGLLLTSSMIARGIGGGQMMTAAGELSDEEARELGENLSLLPERTDFENELLKNIRSELGSRWV